jgi:hypothetical protein
VVAPSRLSHLLVKDYTTPGLLPNEQTVYFVIISASRQSGVPFMGGNLKKSPMTMTMGRPPKRSGDEIGCAFAQGSVVGRLP